MFSALLFSSPVAPLRVKPAPVTTTSSSRGTAVPAFDPSLPHHSNQSPATVLVPRSTAHAMLAGNWPPEFHSSTTNASSADGCPSTVIATVFDVEALPQARYTPTPNKSSLNRIDPAAAAGARLSGGVSRATPAVAG